jgi:hypothetical protein
MKNQKGFLSFHMVVGLIAILGAGGWIANIVKLVSVDVPLAEFGTMEILRIVGIFLAPLGSILGFI